MAATRVTDGGVVGIGGFTKYTGVKLAKLGCGTVDGA
jgi:hypothetical protein